ncbi:guanine nucleotide-binding protein-like 3 homolog isoform X2 [Xenia sp. Carnegie-2017]|uniref:guanine nucleotide-binding protein-like 3 homolog isoform X2 n=2 Tax=Xenia sp. Carnegie-2017 TaxID=2897299 RepID=UPI001F049642|nr:guanine nucleotide-binding protein-like 3 homolog isoform X2 [Xenia sp. Carnegie-2017]
MVRPKKQSKRMTTKKRKKIEKKVREHNQKQRKENNLNRNKKRSKKDPGVPNLCPFKHKILEEVERRKLAQEVEKQKRKQKREKEVNKKRNLQTLQEYAAKRSKEFERKMAHKKINEDFSESDSAPVETSRKAYYKEFKKVVQNSDVVLEVLDARDPLGCRCFKVEEAVLSAGSNKKVVLVLNKIDLVPTSIVEKWLKHLRNEFPTIAFKASTQTQKQHLAQSKVPTSLASKGLLSTSQCMGAGTLMKLLGNYCRNKNIKTAITVGVVGFPNVGKSSLINSLKRSRSCTVGATPGVTKNMQEVQLDKHVKLLDSPGIVMDSGTSDSSIILRNCVKIESLHDLISPVETILKRCEKKQVMEKYRIPDYEDTNQFLCELAKKMGKLKKGGVPDVNAAAKAVLGDWNSGKIVFYTHPPDQHHLPAHVSAEIVQRWGTEFDLISLEKEESDEMRNMKELTRTIQDALILTSSEASSFTLDEEMESTPDEIENVESLDKNDDIEEMEDDEKNNQSDMTVVLSKQTSIDHLDSKMRNTIEINEFNQQINKSQKKEMKRIKRNKRKSKAKAMVKMEERMVDSSNEDYDFETDLTGET